MFVQVLCLCLFGVIVVTPGRPPAPTPPSPFAPLLQQRFCGIKTTFSHLRAVNDSCSVACCSPPKHSLAHVPSPNSCLSVMSVNDIGPQLQPEWFQRGGKKFRSDFFHTASPPLLIPLIGSSMEITRGMIGSTGSRRLRGFPQPLILPPWPPESKKAAD